MNTSLIPLQELVFYILSHFIATAKVVRKGTLWVAREARHPKCLKQSGDSYTRLLLQAR